MATIDGWGVTEQGFYRPTIDDIINEKNKKAKELFGEDFDTGELTPQGKFFRVNAAAESKLCEIAEQVYYAFSPLTATGLSLDRVCSGVNITREDASYAAHIIRVYGTLNHVVPSGTLFRNSAGVEFYSSEDAVIDQPEVSPQTDETIYYADITVWCTESGTIGNVQNISSLVEVDTDITSIMYESVVAYGSDVESDPDLRERYKVVVQGLGANTIAAIKANVMRVQGVNDVIIIDNNSDEDIVVSDTLTVASETYAVIVHTDDQSRRAEIAAAICEKQPLGILQSGLETEQVEDDAGVEHTTKFTFVQPEQLTIVIECDITSDFPATGVDDIKASVTSYINSLGIGEEVVYSQLYNYAYDIVGVYKITSMTINGDTADIPISQIEIAKVGTITVTTTEM